MEMDASGLWCIATVGDDSVLAPFNPQALREGSLWVLPGAVLLPVDAIRQRPWLVPTTVQGCLVEPFHRHPENNALWMTTGAGDNTVVIRKLEAAEAVIVVVEAVRLDHLTSEQLHGLLLGRCLVASAFVKQTVTKYTIVSVELEGGRQGFGVVGSRTRIKVNDSLPGRIAAHQGLATVGIEHWCQRLKADVAAGCWILLWGQRGSGVGTAVAQLHKVAEVVMWSERHSFLARKEKSATSLQPVVVVCDLGDEMFPVDDFPTCRVRALQIKSFLSKSVDAHRRSSVVVRSTRSPPDDIIALFDEVIHFTLPDCAARERMLRHRFPHDSERRVLEIAQACSGKSRRDVLTLPLEALCCGQHLHASTSFDQIGGLRDVKKRLCHTLLDPRRHRSVFDRFGLQPPRGVLLYGPPGCAKTSLVKALCSEQLMNFVYLDGAGLISAYVGESERILRDAFAEAAEKAPCLVFFDELEIIGGRRGSSSTASSDNARLLSTLLMEMDGFVSSSDVVFVGATNMPHLLDPALLRPGRLDQLIYVPLPNHNERMELFCLFLNVDSNTSDLDVAGFADLTDSFSGADIAAVCKVVVGDIGKNLPRHALVDDARTLVADDAVRNAIRSHKVVRYDDRSLTEFRKHMRDA